MKTRKFLSMLMLAAMPLAFASCDDKGEAPAPEGPAAGDEVVEIPSTTIEITVSDIKSDGFFVKYKPSDNDTNYIYQTNIVAKSTIDDEYDGDIEKYVDDQIAQLDPEVLSYRTGKGSKSTTYQHSQATPIYGSTEYVVYSAAVNFDSRMTKAVRGEVFSKVVETASILTNLSDEKFDISYQIINGELEDGSSYQKTARISIKPEIADSETYYFYGTAEEFQFNHEHPYHECHKEVIGGLPGLDYDSIEEFAYEYIKSLFDLAADDGSYDLTQGLNGEPLVFKGAHEFSIEIQELSTTEFYVYVIGVNTKTGVPTTYGSLSEKIVVDKIVYPGDPDEE